MQSQAIQLQESFSDQSCHTPQAVHSFRLRNGPTVRQINLQLPSNMASVRAFCCSLLLILSLNLGNHAPRPAKAQTITDISSRRYFQPGNITLGGLFPVHVKTCSDEGLRTFYVTLAEAMVFAIKEINKNPKILPNITLGFDIQDTCLTSKLAMRSALEYINYNNYASTNADFRSTNVPQTCAGVIRTRQSTPVSAVIGTGTSRSSTLVANLLQVLDMSLVSYAATSDQLSSKNFPNFLRTVPPDRFQSKAMVDIARYFNWTYVATIAADDPYGRSGIEFFRKHAGPQGICLAMERYFPVDISRDERVNVVKDIIDELKTMPNVRVVVLYCDRRGAVDIVTQAQKSGVTGVTWIASEAWSTNRFLSELPKAFDKKEIKGIVGVSFRNVLVERFKNYMLNLNSTYTPTEWWSKFWQHKMWEDELHCTFGNTSGTADRKSKCPAFLQITERIYDKLHDEKDAAVIDATFAIAYAIDNIFRCREPHGLLPGGKCPDTAPFLDPKDVLLYLKNVNVTVLKSQISFDENGDYPGFYTLVNLQEDKNGKGWGFKKIGTWNERREERLVMSDSSIVWNDHVTSPVPKSVCSEVCGPGYRQTRTIGCCWECLACEERSISTEYGARNCTPCGTNQITNAERTRCVDVLIDMVRWSDPLAVVVLLLMVIGIIMTLFVVGVFVKFNDTPLVKAANRELSYFLLFCIAMYYAAPVIYLWEPNNTSCPFHQAWYFYYSITCVTILGAKTHRIVHLFSTTTPNSELRKGFLLRYRHVWAVLGVATFALTVIFIWVLVDPPRPHTNKSLVTEYFLECQPTSNVGGKFCHWFLVAILSVLAVMCGVYAFKARKLPHNFNEAKYIAFAIYVILIAWLTYYPVFIFIRGKYIVILSCFATLISATGLLACIFAPKVFIILVQPDKNTMDFMKAELTEHTFRKRAKERSATTHSQSLSAKDNPSFSTNSTGKHISMDFKSVHVDEVEGSPPKPQKLP